MEDKLRNPLLLQLFYVICGILSIALIASPFSILDKSFLTVAIVLFLVGLSNFRLGLFLFIFFRPLLDYTGAESVMKIGSITLNPPSLVGGLMVLFFLIVILSTRADLKKSRYLVIAWAALLIWAAISLTYTLEPGQTIKEIIKFSGIFLGFVSGYSLVRSNNDLTMLIKALIFSAIIPVLVAISQFIYSTGLADSGRNRLFGTLTHPNMLAFYLLLPIALTVFLYLNIKKTRLESYLYGGLSLVFIFVLAFTYTRGAYLALLVIFFIIGFFKFRRFLIAGSLVLLMIYFLFIPVEQRFNTLFNPSSDGSIAWRLEMWRDGFGLFLNRPLIGYGFGTSDLVFENNSAYAIASSEAHNDYLRLALDGGSIGCALYLVLISILIIALITAYRRETRNRLKMLYLFLLALAISLYLMSFGDNLLNDTALQLDLWVLIGGALSISAFSAIREGQPIN